jgi:hypothetical protein
MSGYGVNLKLIIAALQLVACHLQNTLHNNKLLRMQQFYFNS